jgi:ethanolamine utilization cobalamin adenosyltransferase
MTQLHGRTLVRKDHPRIVLRGRLDSLQSDILMLQARLDGSGAKMKEDLLELLGWVRDLLRCEVLEAELAERAVLGLSATELREHSHNPRKFYHIGHLLPNEKMDLIQLELNRLRSTVREVELAAVSAFSGGEHPAGEQIITALNRMSSGIYVLMLRAAAKIKGYGNESHAG